MERTPFNCVRDDEDDEMSHDSWDDDVNDDDPEPEDSFFDPYEQFQAAAASRRHQGRGQARQREDGNVVDDVAHSDGDEEAFIPSPKKRGRRGRSGSTTRQTVNRMFGQPFEICMDSEAELEEKVQLHGNRVAAGRGFTHATGWKTGKHTSVLLFKCLFAGCPAMLRAERCNVSGTYCLKKSEAETAVTKAAKYTAKGHNAHQERHLPHIAVPGEIRALLTEDRLSMAPLRLRGAIRGITLPDGFKVATLLDARTTAADKFRNGLERLHKEHIKAKRDALMSEGAGNSFGGLSSILEKFDKSSMVASGSFTEHSAFLLGPPLVVPEQQRVTFAISTENLLLNAYRQTCFGLPPMLAVDTTHRLMIASNFCCMLIGTMSVTQHFHIIAYAVCSHEDADAHEYVFRQVFKAVDAVVAAYAEAGKRV